MSNSIYDIKREFKYMTVTDIRFYIKKNNWSVNGSRTKKDLLNVIKNNRKNNNKLSYIKNNDIKLDNLTVLELRKICKNKGFTSKDCRLKKNELIRMLRNEDKAKISKDQTCHRSSFKREGYKSGTKTIMILSDNSRFLPGISTFLELNELNIIRNLIDKRREHNIKIVTRYIVNNNSIYLDSRDRLNLSLFAISKFALQPGTKYVIFNYEDGTIGSYPLWEWIGLYKHHNLNINNESLYIQLLKYWGINADNLPNNAIVELFVLLTYCNNINYNAAATSTEFKIISKLTVEEMAIISNYDNALRFSLILMSLLTGTLLYTDYIEQDTKTSLSIDENLAIVRNVYFNQELFDLMENNVTEYFDLTPPIFIYNMSTVTKNNKFLIALNPAVYYPTINSLNYIIKKFKMIPHPSNFTLKNHDLYIRSSFVDYGDVILNKRISININLLNLHKIKNKNLYSDKAYLEVIPLSAVQVYNNRSELLDYIYLEEKSRNSSHIENKWVLPVYQYGNDTWGLIQNPHFVRFDVKNMCIDLNNLVSGEVKSNEFIYMVLLDLLEYTNIMEDNVYKVLRLDNINNKEYKKFPAILANLRTKINYLLR